MGGCKGIRYYDKATIRFACLCSNDGFELGPVVNRCVDRLRPTEAAAVLKEFGKVRHMLLLPG